MKTKLLVTLTLFLDALVPVRGGSAETPTAATPVAAAFDRVAQLAGTWRLADKPGSPLRIRFSLTAGGSVVVESWELEDRPHSLTLYHRDGAALIATHYCPQENQPRLAFTPTSAGDQLTFSFRDATDLDANESYLTDLRFELTAPDQLIRSEIYRRGDEAERSSLVLVREI